MPIRRLDKQIVIQDTMEECAAVKRDKVALSTDEKLSKARCYVKTTGGRTGITVSVLVWVLSEADPEPRIWVLLGGDSRKHMEGGGSKTRQ